MAAGRNELVYDEDDYVPPGYVPPKPTGGRTKPLVAVVMVGLIIGAIAVFFLTRSRDRTRFARSERARAGQNAVLAANRMAANRPSDPAAQDSLFQSSRHWSKLPGTWSRTPDPKDERGFPVRIEIRHDGSAAVTHPVRLGDSSKLETREAGVLIIIESDTSITVELQSMTVANSQLLLRLTLTPEGYLMLDDKMSGIVFTMEK